MKKRLRLASRIAIIAAVVVAAIGGFVYWQMAHFSLDITAADADSTKQVVMSAFAPIVLAPGVDGATPKPRESHALLDEYQKNPELIHRRYLLVMTWMHAAQILKAIGKKSPTEDRMINSVSLDGVSAENRVDGWGVPYCILVDPNQMTFLSSGGNGAIECAKLQQTAKQAALNASGPRLTRAGNLLVTVLSRAADPPAIGPALK